MIDREKVIKALEYCKDEKNSCTDCFYREQCSKTGIKADALALLKEQQQQIWEFQDQVEYLTDKLKEQEGR